ncbi:MAG: hypothetical protein ABI821_07775 [Pseudomonadota bacterium]
MKRNAAILRILGTAGALLFAFFFMLTFWRPLWVETFAADFIRSEVANEVDQRIEKLSFEGASETLSAVAAAIYRRNQEKIDDYREGLKVRAHERIAACIATMLELESGARARIARALEAGSLQEISSLSAVNERLTDFIQGRYLRIVGELKHDLRIFTATNVGCFLLLLLATFLRPEFMRQLFVPGLLLLAATLYCAWCYVFQQNWLLTIIYSDYLGFAYLAYLGVFFLFLCDVVLNYGRVTIAMGVGLISMGGAVPSSRRRS